jgi:hypothetical protein
MLVTGHKLDLVITFVTIIYENENQVGMCEFQQNDVSAAAKVLLALTFWQVGWNTEYACHSDIHVILNFGTSLYIPAVRLVCFTHSPPFKCLKNLPLARTIF